MKPLRIRMQAFGPFAGSETVDFTRLGERAFFLIHGPTGAGKTTLLDALCFALYGDTSGGERDARAMRSDHAAPDLPTQVELEFSLGAARYRVLRSPAQSRPKLRGEGLREEPASAELYEWREGAWQALALRQVGKVNDRVRELIGFDGAQFRQVIVLPQGRFREVLTADSKGRQAIMEKLFRTELYSRIERALKEAAAGLVAEVARLDQQRAGILNQVQLEASEALTQALAAQDALLGEAATALAARRESWLQAQAQLDLGRKAAAGLQALEEARHACAGLEASVPAHEARLALLLRAREAEVLRPVQAEQLRSEQALQVSGRLLDEARQTLERATLAAETAAATLQIEQAREPERELARARLATLEHAGQALQRWQEAGARHEQARAELSRLQREQEAGRNKRAALATALNAAEQGLQQQAALAAALTLRRDAHEQLARRLRSLEMLDRAVQEERVEAERANRSLALAQAARDARERAGVRREQAERAWLAGQAARLAKVLVEGEACPVCGGRDHPAPAQEAGDHLDDEALEAVRAAVLEAEAAERQAGLDSNSAQARLQSAQSRVQTLIETLGDDASLGLDQLRLTLSEAAAALDEATKAEARVPALTAAREAANRALVAQDEASAALEEGLQAVQTHLAVLAERRQEAEQSVPEPLRLPGALDTALSQARSDLQALQQALVRATEAERSAASALAASRAACDTLGKRQEADRLSHERAVAALAEALAARRFADVMSWQAALMTPAALAEAGKAAELFDRQLAAARDRLSRATEAASGLLPPDLAGLERALGEASEAMSQAISLQEQLRGRREELGRAAGKLEALAAAGAEIQARYAVLGRISEIANGQNPLNMSFQRYVLATLLDEVLEAASLRLLRMSRRRYELRRVTTQADKRQAGGLDLEVFDHQTGSARPANTLSGGEGFIAALSLALGLADVVQSRTGGIQLETLFIDEGFGTLDPESLDFAINTLIDLQQGGRLVGIISHVAELRERIDVRLEVRPAEQGSRIAFVI
ncbi:AAA family ATPase [Uliginosibacterium paludis]|uniref:AAA family ATPase n=1 Tax=Uliginosibacterium paludis TaxID=1615952 RepID=A0ABV2CKV5_9RHOO